MANKYRIIEEISIANEAAIQYLSSDLGLSDLSNLDNDLVLMQMAKKGISYQSFERIISNIPFSLIQWADFLSIPLRTLYRYKKNNRIFLDYHAERILEIIRLIKAGSEFFDNMDHFYNWLNIPNIATNNKKPMQLLSSSFGIKVLIDQLGRMGNGIFN